MRYIWQHIATIIETYDGSFPLAHFIKNYFKQYPILGSRDRRMLNAMAYSYYRCARGIAHLQLSMQEQVIACMALCGYQKLLPPDISVPDIKDIQFEPGNLFANGIEISAGIPKEEWLHSMLLQPNLFIRIRKDNGKLLSLLNSKQIPFTFITDNCISLPNGAKIDALLPPDTYVVQDASSQHTGTFFRPKKNELWYDCCSGAGGKSILLKDMEPGVRLTISDKRETIIYNLQQRFKQYRHILPVAHVTDVTNKQQLEKALGNKQFDNIICDAPCSGSGTWARTPEQLYFFDTAKLKEFATLQQTIAINVCKYLKPGGRLLYITCSVFKEENEGVVEEIIKQSGLKEASSGIINGTAIHADSMFVAELSQ